MSLDHFCFRQEKHQYLKYIGNSTNYKNLHRSQHVPPEVKAPSRWLSQIHFDELNCSLQAPSYLISVPRIGQPLIQCQGLGVGS